MKIDLHTHCNPGSKCARVLPEDLPALLKAEGIDGFVLTNHCYPKHCDTLSEDIKEQPHRFIEIFHRAKAKAEELGMKAFFGVEVKLINEEKKMEFLLYGISEEEFINSFPLYTLSQKELFEYCNEKDILMIQAHPFREEQGYSPADPRYLHGVEVVNPHVYFADRSEDAKKYADELGVLQTGGSDFHYPEQAGVASVYIPDEVEDQFMLRDYIRANKLEFFRQAPKPMEK